MKQPVCRLDSAISIDAHHTSSLFIHRASWLCSAWYHHKRASVRVWHRPATKWHFERPSNDCFCARTLAGAGKRKLCASSLVCAASRRPATVNNHSLDTRARHSPLRSLIVKRGARPSPPQVPTPPHQHTVIDGTRLLIAGWPLSSRAARPRLRNAMSIITPLTLKKNQRRSTCLGD